MSDLMKILLQLSLSGTALAAGLAVLRRLLKDKLPKTLFYYLWLLVLLRLIVPIALPLPEAVRTHEAQALPTVSQPQIQIEPQWNAAVQQPQIQPAPGPSVQQWESIVPSGTAPSASSTVLPPSDPWHLQLWDFFCDYFAIIWLTGTALHFLWFALSYLRFCHHLRDDCTPLLEHEQAFLEDLCQGRTVAACRSPLVSTPMLVGLVHHRIILPDAPITTRQLEYILRHELTHLRRRDLLYKWFVIAVTSFHWFNPRMPWLRREIARCCELSCDEAVIGTLNDQQKQWYGETLLALAALHALPRAVPATTLCEEKTQLKERLLSIMKHKKATALILLLSCLLALLIAGCAAVLGPQEAVKEKTIIGPLTEEQQTPILEDLRAWAAENLPDQSVHLNYYPPDEEPFLMGRLTELGEYYLYDLTRGEVRPLDGTYPDVAQLGYVILSDSETAASYIYTFYLTKGDPAKAASPFAALEQLAADHPQGRATQLIWRRMDGQYPYIRVDFAADGVGYCFDYTAVNGLSGVRENASALQREQGMTLPQLVQALRAVTAWQERESDAHDRENYHLSLWQPRMVESMVNYGDFEQYQDVVVYDLATDKASLAQLPYTGATKYGAFSLLYPAEDPERWVYLVDDSGDHALRAGMLAVVTEDAPLENARAHTVDDLGREILMDMATTVEKGTLVSVDSVDGANCEITVLAGEPPRVQGRLNARLLTTDLTDSKQVILTDTQIYNDAGGKVMGTCSGVADILRQTAHWLQVTLPGGENPFWVRRVDLTWEWPIVESATPENMTAAQLKSYYMDFAMDWRVDFIPDFDWNSFSGTVSTQDFLMLTWYQNQDSLPEGGSMAAELVERVMQNQFGIESIRHESLFKTWNWDEAGRKYLPVPQGVAEEGLFDVISFGSAMRWVDGSEQTVYNVTLREYGYPFVFGSEQYSDLVNCAADDSAYYRKNVAFLLENKGDLLKKGEISAFEAIRQLISEGNTAGFTKGTEIRLEYYMTGNGPRFTYKSEREFDFTPGDVYENEAMGFRMTFPASWTGKYRLVELEDTVRIDDAWGGTLCSVFRQEAAGFVEEHIPVPYRVLGRNSQSVWLMYFASDVQYNPANAEQTTAYLGMYQDLQYVPFEILPAKVEPGTVTLNSSSPLAKAIAQTEYTPALPTEPRQSGADSDYDVVFYYKATSRGPWELEIAPQNAEEWVPLSARQAGFAGSCTCGAHGEDWVIVKYRANFDNKTNGRFRLRMVSTDDGTVGGLYENIPISGTDTLLVDLSELMVSKMAYCAFCPAAWTGRETALPPGLPHASVSLGEARYFLVYAQVLGSRQNGYRHTFCFWNSLDNTIAPLYTLEDDGGELWTLSRKDDLVICNNGIRVLQFRISAETWGGISTWSKNELTKEGNPFLSVSPSQTRYAERQDEAVVIREMSTDRELGRLEGFRNINRMVWSGDESRLAVLSDHAFVTVWDLTAGTVTRYQDEHPKGWVSIRNVRLTDSGKQAFMQYLCEDEAAIVVWDVETNRKTDTITGQDLDLVDVRGSALLYFHSQKAPFQTVANIYDGAAGTSRTVDSFKGYYTMGCFTGSNWDVLVNRYDIATYESRLMVVNAVQKQEPKISELVWKLEKDSLEYQTGAKFLPASALPDMMAALKNWQIYHSGWDEPEKCVMTLYDSIEMKAFEDVEWEQQAIYGLENGIIVPKMENQVFVSAHPAIVISTPAGEEKWVCWLTDGSAEPRGNVQPPLKTLDLYNAAKAVQEYFNANFTDCDMTALWYDKAYSETLLKDYRPGTYTTENTIVLLCDFTPGEKCELIFTPGHVQSGWNWIFAKQPDGSWEHVDHGY